MKELRFTLSTLLIWILIGAIAGIAGAATVALFNYLLEYTISQTASLAKNLIFLLPLAGAITAGLLVVRYVPDAGGEGTQSYIKYMNTDNNSLGLAATILRFPATVVTLGLHCSGGIVGPLCRIGAGLSNFIVRSVFHLFKSDKERYARIAALCGVSGIVSSIFHSPIGGAIFAVEILQKASMKYKDIFPSIISGVIAYTVSKNLLSQIPVFTINAPEGSISGIGILHQTGVAVVTGAVGLAFVVIYKLSLRLFTPIRKKQPLAAIIGSTVTSLFIIAGLIHISSTSMTLFTSIVRGDINSILPGTYTGWKLALILLSIIIAKIVATASTIGSGLSAGLTGPFIVVGILCGATLSIIMGVPAGSAEFFAFLATGIAAMLGSAMNIPLAACLLVIRIFGASYLVPALLGSVISYILFKPEVVFEYIEKSAVTS